VSWRPWLDRDGVLTKLPGLPPYAFDLLVRVMVRLCEDPYDPVFSVPASKEARRRVAELDDFGWMVFVVDEPAGLVRVIELVWVG
jgi:hypothetical protein